MLMASLMLMHSEIAKVLGNKIRKQKGKHYAFYKDSVSSVEKGVCMGTKEQK